MSYKFKEFFTLEEARKYISDAGVSAFPITDLYRSAVDKNLIISVRLIDQVNAIAGKVIRGAEVIHDPFYLNLINNKKIEEPFSLCLDDGMSLEKNKWAIFDDEVYFIEGIWDFPMLGMESLVIEKLYLEELGVRPQKNSAHQGIFLQRGDDICKLQTQLSHEQIEEKNLELYKEAKDILIPKNITIDNYFDGKDSNLLFSRSENDKLARFFEIMREKTNDVESYEDSLTLDDCSYQLVIKTKELFRFVQSLQEKETNLQQEEKPLSTKERNTLLVLFGSMLNKANFVLGERGLTAKIKKATELINTPVSEQTIRDILPQVKEAISLKQK
jgi:hypothetical protein